MDASKEPIQEVVAVSDPGEIGRAEHNRGDRFVVFVSNIAAWLFPILMIAICAQVVLRNAGMNQAWLDDLQWWLYGAAVLIGVGYAVTTDSHVRVDIFYDNFDSDKKTRVNLFAIGWLFLPFVILSWDVTSSYAVSSVMSNEGSDSPNGLHNLWILKIFMNLAFIFIAVACIAAIIRYVERLHYPAIWRVMLAALPSTFFILNLMLYYGLWGVLWLMREEGASARDVSRHDLLDEIDIGNYETTLTVIAALVLTPIVILIARSFDRSRRTAG